MGFLSLLTLMVVLRSTPAFEGEGAWLRWLRVCADHPWRTLGACVLLELSLRRGAPSAQGGAPSA